MANVYHYFDPLGAGISSSGIPEPVSIQPTTPANQATQWGLALATGEFFQHKFRAINYASGNVTVDIDWFSRSKSTANNCAFSAQICCVTPTTDSFDVTADAFATATQAQQTVAATGGRMYRTQVVVSNLDSLAQDDYVVLKVARATPTGTDMTGDAAVCLVTVSYLSI